MLNEKSPPGLDPSDLEMAELTKETFTPHTPVLPSPASASPASPRKLTATTIIPIWILLSSSVIIYNNYVYNTLEFKYPVFTVTWHLTFAAIGTRVLQRTTNLLDGARDVHMDQALFLRRILPIGILFSGSLILSNTAYLYLSVSYIQMLKAFTPVAILLISWTFQLQDPNKKLGLIVVMISCGVALASHGERLFHLGGFLVQAGAVLVSNLFLFLQSRVDDSYVLLSLTSILHFLHLPSPSLHLPFSALRTSRRPQFEASRLVLIQILLHNMKMDPLVSLHYYAPVCALINLCILPFTEGLAPFRDLHLLGPLVLLTNAGVAFLLNVAAVFLVGVGSGLVLTLAGVFKDILLISGSVVIFGNAITPLQVFGYSIALGGLVLFKTSGGK
ncbi:TPT-domain-containing protein [Lyophyllum atratum]|nr:TPT-domain-containing protein [Lyophyllum atratum]